jgi:peroxiredoxin family protein
MHEKKKSLYHCLFMTTNVACTIGPSVNTLFFTFSELKILKFGNVNTLTAQLIFPFQTQFLQFV